MASEGAVTEKQRQEAYIRALLEERDACERAGKTDRVEAIDAELGRKAATAATAAKRSERRPASAQGETR